MKRLLFLAFAFTAVAANAQLWDNGPMITHVGAGAGGADVSMASSNANSGGNNQFYQNNVAQPMYFTVADDFTVGGAGWNVTDIRTYGYQTGAVTPGWTGFSLSIFNGDPSAGGTVIHTFNSATVAYTGINRVFNGVGNLLNADRRIHSLDWNTPMTLAPGTYWLAVQLSGGASAWNPYVMDINPADPNNPFTRVGNAQIYNQPVTGTFQWSPGTVTGFNNAPEHPFIINGSPVPEPATMIALAGGLAAVVARRRRRS